MKSPCGRISLVRSPRLCLVITVRDRPTTVDLPAPRSEKSVSACPGLLRIVQALDGGICRVKLAGGVLSSQQARAIAEAAERCASGVLELTNRSNLQIRGVLAEQQDALIERLLAADLGPSNPAADDVRNLLLSPAAGLDPQALLDTRPLAAALLDLLQNTPALHGLSAKFALQLDGGEALAMREHPHDIWLSALPGTPARLAFGLAGCPTDTPLGVVDGEQAVALVEHLLMLFLQLAGNEHNRMRQLLSALPAPQLLQQLQARLPFAVQAPPPTWQRAPASQRAPMGTYPQQQIGLCMVAAGARLGRIDAGQLRAVAELAEQYGDASLRLTPWQGLLLPNIPEQSAEALVKKLADLGLLTDAQEPLSQLIACTGSAACAKGLSDSKADALRLAERLRTSTARPQVHLSACPRSCAAAHVAPFTLLASSAGHYQLYQRTPQQPGFGQLLADAITIDEAGDWFATHCATGNSDA
ncbi:precorrin-3B synthase [Pseudomonas cuatrocienegasensis]|uniref:Precorrin-3B synthase n=1 Tax=Pseudomonas cuatrocienegasensis TaxID=543360 RepID=A0ABY1BI31_9PSED|nr:precorrin-3B synthase [Pseudomonas cuatrocienegasensis]